MKVFDFDDIFAHPKYVLDKVGAWPASSLTLWDKLKTYCSIIGTFVLTVFCISQSFIHFGNGNMEDGCFGMCIVIAAGHASFKVWFLQRKRPLFLQIVQSLKDPALTSHEDQFDKYLQNKIILSYRVRTFLLTSTMLCVGSIVVTDIMEDYRITSRLLLFQTTIDHFPKYLAIQIFFIVTHLQTGWVIGAYEGLMFTLISIASAQLKLLTKEITYSLEHITHRDLSPKELEERDFQVNQALKKCVLRHNAIEQYVAAVEEKFTFGILVQMLLTLMVTGLIGFCLMFASKTSLNFYKCIFFFIADMTQVAIVCFACHEIIFQSEYVRDACYMSNWNYCGPTVAKTLIIMMERSKRPFGFTASKFTTVSLQTFIALLKTSMSYFAVLKSMYLDS